MPLNPQIVIRTGEAPITTATRVPGILPVALYRRRVIYLRAPMAAEQHGLPVSRRAFVQGAGLAGLGLLAGCRWLSAKSAGAHPPVIDARGVCSAIQRVLV
jgi:hypothetical protein